MKYKVITLTQPWATLVAIGAKKIETRSWPTNYRGPLLIHAGAGLGPVGGMQGLIDMCQQDYFFDALTSAGYTHWGNLEKGAIVAAADLVDCVPSEKIMAAFGAYGPTTKSGGHKLWTLSDQELAFGDYTPRRYGWLLDNVRRLAEPIPARGQLGLWDWEDEI